MQVGSPIGDAPISVSVVEDSPNGFVILGTALPTGTMHGQLLKVSTATLARISELEFDDDNGRGVTAGCNGKDSTFFFAAGSSPATIYRVNSQLEILSRITVNSNEIASLHYDGSNFLAAASESTVHLFQTTGAAINVASVPPVQLAASLGLITSGFIDTRGANPVLYYGTDSAPAAVVKVNLTATSADVQSFRLRAGQDKITTATSKDDVAVFGLGVDGSQFTCYAVKVSLSEFSEVDIVDLKNCTADLISATMSGDGEYVYLGNAASPAHVYAVRVSALNTCPEDCNHHGTCVKGLCQCDTDYTGAACSTAILHCPNNCSNAGTCLNGVCTCSSGHSGADCSSTELCTSKCVHGHCAGENNTWPCACDSTVWTGRYCSDAVNYCPNSCSRHGLCENGICQCDNNYEGADCSVEKYPLQSARGCRLNSECGAHGLCTVDVNGTGSCHCEEGWTGGDCDVTQQFHDAVAAPPAEKGISPALIGVLVAAALVVGMIAGVSIWKSWMGSSSYAGSGATTPSVAGLTSGPSKVAQGGYTRLPRRLVK